MTLSEKDLAKRLNELEERVRQLERQRIPPFRAVWLGSEIIELKPDIPHWEGTCLACRDGTCTRTEHHT